MSTSRALARGLLLALGVLGTLASASAPAQPRLVAAAQPGVVETGSAAYRFERFTLPAREAGRTYDVVVAIPRRAAPEGGFPLVTLLDGGAAIEAIDEALLRRLETGATPPVLVAVGYVGQPRFDVKARAFDYTPAPARHPQAPLVDDQGRPGGGAARFLALIGTRIVPRVATMAPIDPTRETLWGHSYGGLFVLYAATRQHVPFATFVAADPALWWNYGSFLKDPKRVRKAPDGGPRAITVVRGEGGAHRGGRPGAAQATALAKGPHPDMRGSVAPEAAVTLARQLADQGAHVTLTRCTGQGHGAMFALSLRAALIAAAGAAPDPAAPECGAEAIASAEPE
ncbi:alpha/beta hydrolase-fold protein [Novosphingobium sp. 1949]|uniref:Alpha/beta hydrolase-fold protein n=1 Tax=Novosphingobium organovorum TaxID=2930092 RepID=A0ABT0BEN9_9SPHN|nr:alpha/beta hydrolase-fold protein [Novosphingobium organovorum]MCJ2183532.1 alpha/beta hydrolase-fold protein [Novosphingobium organovorum]